jgi:hypothetical protein
MIATISEFGDLVDIVVGDVVIGVGEPLRVEYEAVCKVVIEAVVVCIVVVGGGVTEKVNSTKEKNHLPRKLSPVMCQ